MSYPVPTLQHAVERARERMRAEMPGTDASVWPNTNYVYAKVWGGLTWDLYQYISWVARQRFATTADGDMLDEHGAQYALARRPAQAANGYAVVEGPFGTFLPAGTQFQAASGVVFETTQDVTIEPIQQSLVHVEATEVGPRGNTVAGALLEPVAVLPITRVYVDENGLGGGADVEDDESYRARILLRIQLPPHGGAEHDYLQWALTIPGVTRAWVDPLAYGPGTVGVWVMEDNGGHPYGLPSPQVVGAVAAYIEAQRPATARVFVQAPLAANIQVEIKGIGYPLTPLQTAIENELRDVFRRNVSVSRPKRPYTLRNNVLWQAVARATGDSVHKVTIPAADIVLPAGYIPVYDGITFID